MTISFIGSVVGTTSATIPTHAAGDLLVAIATRDGNNAAPTVPSGWTSRATNAANTIGAVIATREATAAGTASGTWTNATSLVILVYRRTGTAWNIGAVQATSGTAASVTYAALTLTRTAGDAWVLCGAGHRSVNTTLETAPSGTTQRATQVDATDEVAAFDTNGGVSSWTSKAVAVGGTASGWVTFALEFWETPAVSGTTVSKTITDDADDGVYIQGSVSGGNTWYATTTGTVFGNAQSFSASNDDRRPGWRFAGMAVPQGATIVAAKLAVWVGDKSGSSPSTFGSIYGAAEDDFALLSNSHYPHNITKTTASVSIGDPVVDSAVTNYNITAIIQEIVSRPGWTSGNAIGLIGGGASSGSGGVTFYDYSIAVDYDDLTLLTAMEITYTGGSGGTPYSLACDGGSLALTGASASVLTGRRLSADAGALAVVGNNAGLSGGKTLVAEAGSVSLSGAAVGLQVNQSLSAAPGALAITGSPAALATGRVLAAAAGEVSIAGAMASLGRGYGLTADAGSASIGGQGANLAAGRRVQGAAGSTSIAGNDANLSSGRRLAGEGSPIAVSGSAAELSYGSLTLRRMDAQSGTAVVAGSDVAFRRSRLVAADAGAMILSSADAGLLRRSRMMADSGQIAVAGADIVAAQMRRMIAGSGSFAVTGGDIASDRQRKLVADGGEIELSGAEVVFALFQITKRRISMNARLDRDATFAAEIETVRLAGVASDRVEMIAKRSGNDT